MNNGCHDTSNLLSNKVRNDKGSSYEGIELSATLKMIWHDKS